MNVKIRHVTLSTSKPSNIGIEKLQSSCLFSQITFGIILDHQSPKPLIEVNKILLFLFILFSELSPLEFSVFLNALPCSLAFHRDASFDFKVLIKEVSSLFFFCLIFMILLRLPDILSPLWKFKAGVRVLRNWYRLINNKKVWKMKVFYCGHALHEMQKSCCWKDLLGCN